MVHAVLGLVANVPDRQMRRAFRILSGNGLGHVTQGFDHLQLSRRLSGQVENPFEVPQPELSQGKFQEDPGFAETGGCFQKEGALALVHGGGELGLDTFLTQAQLGEGRAESQRPLAVPGPKPKR